MMDLGATALAALDSAELDRLALATAVLLYAGHKASEGQPSLRSIGSRLAGLCFVGYAIHLIWRRQFVTDDVFEVVLRCVLVTALSLGACWIVVPVAAWVLDCTLGNVWRVSLRFLAGLWRGGLCIWRACWQFPGKVVARLRHLFNRKSALAQAVAFAEALKRRDETRARCDMLYNLHAFVLKERFPPEAFEKLKQRYLRDDLNPTDFEARAKQLCDIVNQHAANAGADGSQSSIEELVDELQRKHEQINSSNLDDLMKQSLNLALDEQFEERIRKAVNK